MSLALLSAISFVCIDAQMAVRPLPPVAAVVATAIQAAPETQAEETTAPKNQDGESDLVTPPEESLSPLVFEDESDQAVAERLIDYLENIDTLKGDFTQVAPSGAIAKGRFYLRRPGMLRFEYDPPSPLLIVANGGLVYVRDDALETTDSYPVRKTPLKFLLNRKINLDDAEIVAVDRGVDTAAVTFASDDEETEGELTVIVRAPEIALERWVVRDLQNGITVVTLDNVQEGVRLANRLFRAPEAGGAFLKN
ncbi:MAG: outer membrane lipoprotein carrier protein LolA [Parvularculaceae bacterium]